MEHALHIQGHEFHPKHTNKPDKTYKCMFFNYYYFVVLCARVVKLIVFISVISLWRSMF